MALNDSKSVGTKHTVKYVNKLALNKATSYKSRK